MLQLKFNYIFHRVGGISLTEITNDGRTKSSFTQHIVIIHDVNGYQCCCCQYKTAEYFNALLVVTTCVQNHNKCSLWLGYATAVFIYVSYAMSIFPKHSVHSLNAKDGSMLSIYLRFTPCYSSTRIES